MNNKHYIIPIFVPHYGCPHQCVFCDQRSISGIQKHVTSDDVKSIINEYMATIKESDNVELAFYGGSFTGIPIEKQKELLEAAQEYIKDGSIHSIRLSTRPDYINEKILDVLKEYNVSTIELGVQSMHDQVLEASNRGHTRQDVINASKLIKEYGFELGHQMMIGLPEDTLSRDIVTANQLIELKPSIVRIYPVLVIKGTELETMYKTGYYTPISLENAVEISKEILKLFIINGITVIRIGLQVTDNINYGRDVVAGPFHPAFRDLVMSRLRLDMMVYMLRNCQYEKNNLLLIYANNKEISKTVGHNKINIEKLKEEFAFDQVVVIGDESLDKGHVILKIDDKTIEMNEKNYIEDTTQK